MRIKNQSRKIKKEPAFEKSGGEVGVPDVAVSPTVSCKFRMPMSEQVVQKCLCSQNVFRGLQTTDIKKIYKKGICKKYNTNEVITSQGDIGGIVFFILNGRVDVFVNGCRIGTRKAKECVGEMSTIDPTQNRSATLRSAEPCYLFEVRADDFEELCKSYPQILMNVCVELCDRLRERSKFHHSPNAIPELFIGSSKEGLGIAKKFKKAIEKVVPNIKISIWDKGVFGLSKNNLDSLVMEAKKCDFAIMVMTADDSLKTRKSTCRAPRDNVVFELGLFMGTIGNERTFLVRSSDSKLPTDLDGITYVEIDPKAKSIPSVKIEQIVSVLKEKGAKK